MAGMDALAITKWSARIQELYESKLRFAAMCNRDYEGDVKMAGTVKIFSPAPVSIGSYTRGSTTIAYQRATPGEQEFKITQRDYFALEYDDLEGLLAFAKGSIWQRTIREGTYQLAKTVDTYISGTVFPAGIATSNTLTPRILSAGDLGSSAYELIVDMAKVLEDNDIDPSTASVCVPPAFKSLLKKDQRFTGYNTSDAQANIAGRPIGEIENMKVLQSTNTPVSGSSYTIWAAGIDACTYAEQLSDLEELPRDKDDFENRMRSQLVFDAKVVQPKALVKCVVQFAA